MPATQTKVPPPPAPAGGVAVQVNHSIEGLDTFLSHVAHEVRTPLSAILLWARLLDELGGQDPAQLKEAVGAIQKSAGELQQMIEDLLDVSRVLTGKIQAEPQPTDLDQAVQEAVEAVQPLATDQGIEIALRQESAGESVYADPVRLVQILRNLLRRAIEVSPVGGRVSVTTLRKGGEIEIAVSDSGPGLAPELENHVFDHFGLSAGPNGHPGSGAALAVVRRLVELHKGRIRAHSGPGPGTTYTVWLPHESAGAPDVSGDEDPIDELPAGNRPLQGRRILVVEDSAETRRALTMILNDAGAEVVPVGSSSAALSAFKQGQIDLVVSDLGLPKMDGYEMMQQFRRWERLDAKPPVPAVALTAFVGEGTRRRAFQSGYHGCLTKPVEPARLITALSGLMRLRRETAA